MSQSYRYHYFYLLTFNHSGKKSQTFIHIFLFIFITYFFASTKLMSYLFIIFLFIMSKIVLFIYLLSLSSYFQFIIFNHVSSPKWDAFFSFLFIFYYNFMYNHPFFSTIKWYIPHMNPAKGFPSFHPYISPSRQGRVSMATMIRVMQSPICKPLSDLLAASGN